MKYFLFMWGITLCLMGVFYKIVPIYVLVISTSLTGGAIIGTNLALITAKIKEKRMVREYLTTTRRMNNE